MTGVGVGGGSGAHRLWNQPKGSERGMSPREGGMKGRGAEKVKSPCQSERQVILAMNKHICVVHIMPGIKPAAGGGTAHNMSSANGRNRHR